LRLLIPKAFEEQERWRQALSSTKADIVFADPWQLDLLPESPEMRTVWLNLDKYCGVICVSPSAAKSLIHTLDTYWPMPPVNVHWLCNGPRTANVLAKAGVQAVYPSAGHTAEDVLALSETKTQIGDNWLIVKGEGGRLIYSVELTERGAEVVSQVVYRRSMSASGLSDLVTKASTSDGIWLSSEFLGQQMLIDNEPFWREWPGHWWVSSERIARWAKGAGFKRIRVGSGATPEVLQTMITKTDQ